LKLHPWIKENKAECVVAAIFAFAAAGEIARVAVTPLSQQSYREGKNWTGHRTPDDIPGDVYVFRSAWGLAVYEQPAGEMKPENETRFAQVPGVER
jgi:hypothetical protein